jgi:hypothetical protein
VDERVTIGPVGFAYDAELGHRADTFLSSMWPLPYSSYKYHSAPPGRRCEESEVLPPPLQGASKFNLCRVERERERQGSEGRRTSQLIGSPRSSSSAEALPESIWVRWSFLSSSSVECGSSAGILQTPIESRLSSPSGVLGSRLVRIPMTLPQSG